MPRGTKEGEEFIQPQDETMRYGHMDRFLCLEAHKDKKELLGHDEITYEHEQTGLELNKGQILLTDTNKG